MNTNDPKYPGSFEQAKQIIRNLNSVDQRDMDAVIREWREADKKNQKREANNSETQK